MSECTPFEERIVDVLAGELPAAERDAFLAHAASCATCGETLRAYQAIESAYRDLPDAEAPPLAAHVRIEAYALPARRARRGRNLRWLALAAALLAVIVPLALWLAREPREARDWLERANVQREVGDVDGARSSYVRAIGLSYDGAVARESRYRLALLELGEGRSEQALVLLEGVPGDPDTIPSIPEAAMLRAELLARAGRTGEAWTAYDEVARSDSPLNELARERQQALFFGVRTVPLADPLEALSGLGYVGD